MEKKPTKKTYVKPSIKSEEILKAGLGSTCNGKASGGRKDSTTSGCWADRLKT